MNVNFIISNHDHRHVCEALKWTMEHELHKNVANAKKWGIVNL